jgi:muconolactone delta-isomerase
MEIMLHGKIKKPEGASNKEFFEVWRQESVAAMEAVSAGVIKHIWKVAGKYEVIVVLDVEDGDGMDEVVHSLPIWKLGYAHVVWDISWTPLRPYANWAEHLKTLSKGEW